MWSTSDLDELAQFLAPDDSALASELVDEVVRAGGRILGARAELEEELRATSVAHVRGLFSDRFCDLLDEHLREQTTTVTEHVEATEGRWRIDLIDNDYHPMSETVARDPFSVLCLAPAFWEAVGRVSGFDEQVITTRRWVNRYGPGDSIAPHDDTTGDFQIMICVCAPPASAGGALQFESGLSVDLQRGDLLIMRHAGLVHWTTPLAADTPTERATATCRYYVEGGRLPGSRVYAHSSSGPKTATAAGSTR